MQLPLIKGKPYTPKRTIKPWFEEYECTGIFEPAQYTTNARDCTRNCTRICFCKNQPSAQHTYTHGTCETHTHSKRIEPPRNGSGWLERKASGEIVYHTPWLKKSKPFRETWKSIAEPKARIETPAKALSRMRKECVTPDDVKARGVLDKVTPQGYFIAATNGHWALMERWNSKGKEYGCLDIAEKAHNTTVESSEFYNALQRAAVMANDRSRMVVLIAENDSITLYSADSDYGAFVETIPAKVSKPWRAAVDWTYLEMALGVWPLTFWIKDEESALVLEPWSKEYRFVLMPMHSELNRDVKAARQMNTEAEETSRMERKRGIRK